MPARARGPSRAGLPVTSDRMTSAVRVLVLDDTRLYREGLANILQGEEWVAAVDTAAGAEAALDRVGRFSPDVVLVNMAMVGSVAILGAVVGAAPHACVVAIGVSEREDDVVVCAEAGMIRRSTAMISFMVVPSQRRLRRPQHNSGRPAQKMAGCRIGPLYFQAFGPHSWHQPRRLRSH